MQSRGLRRLATERAATSAPQQAMTATLRHPYAAAAIRSSHRIHPYHMNSNSSCSSHTMHRLGGVAAVPTAAVTAVGGATTYQQHRHQGCTPVSSPVAACTQRRAVSFTTTCTTKGFIIPPPRDVDESVAMHPLTAAFVDSVLGSTTSAASEEQNSKKKSAKACKDSAPVTLKTGNVLLVGPHGCGKRTNLLLATKALEAAGKRVAVISGEFLRVHSLGGVYMHHFLGLRVGDNLPIYDQMRGMFRRHTILLEKAYDNLLPSLANSDVLIFDSIHNATPSMVRAMDAVCKEVRKSSAPFGGLRILAGANFWRLPDVHPTSDYGGYLFQQSEFDQWFDQWYLATIHHQRDPILRALTAKATMGEFTVADAKQLEALAVGEPSKAMIPTPMVDYAAAYSAIVPRFPKQQSRRLMPAKMASLKRTEFGSFLGGILQSPFTFPTAFGLSDRLALEAGTPVHLVYATSAVPIGEHGIIEVVNEGSIVVNFPRLRRSLTVPPMRFVTCHKDHPEIAVTTLQYPLKVRTILHGNLIAKEPNFWNVQLDGLYFTETNHLGVILGRMRSFEDFTALNMDKPLKLEGMVHEATRAYVQNLQTTGRSDTVTVLKDEQWCRNCKHYIAPEAFYEHWKSCLNQVRWCTDCNRTIPVSKYRSHREKHQIVVCIDCAQAVEWKNWETHRLTCGPMLREVSSENELLPERTRQVAMQFGLDRRDLHTVKKFTKGSLPSARLLTRKSRKLHDAAVQQRITNSDTQGDLRALSQIPK